VIVAPGFSRRANRHLKPGVYPHFALALKGPDAPAIITVRKNVFSRGRKGMSRIFFGALLAIVGLLYLWLAYQSVQPGLGKSDWVPYLGGLLFLVAGVAAAVAAVNLLRPKRR